MRLHFDWLLTLLFLVSTFTTTVSASAAEPDAVAASVWNKLLAHCGEDYFYSGSVFDGSGTLSGLVVSKNADLIQFRGVKFSLVPIRLTDADRLNGQEFRGRLTMIAHLFKPDEKDGWMDGPAFQARNTDDMFAKSLMNIANDSTELGIGGAMAFELIKYKGKWYIERSSVMLSGGLFGSKTYEVNALLAAHFQRYQCSTKLVSYSPAELAAIAKEKAGVDLNAKAAAQANLSPPINSGTASTSEPSRSSAPVPTERTASASPPPPMPPLPVGTFLSCLKHGGEDLGAVYTVDADQSVPYARLPDLFSGQVRDAWSKDNHKEPLSIFSVDFSTYPRLKKGTTLREILGVAPHQEHGSLIAYNGNGLFMDEVGYVVIPARYLVPCK